MLLPPGHLSVQRWSRNWWALHPTKSHGARIQVMRSSQRLNAPTFRDGAAEKPAFPLNRVLRHLSHADYCITTWPRGENSAWSGWVPSAPRSGREAPAPSQGRPSHLSNGCQRHVTAVARGGGALGSAHAPCAGPRGSGCEGRRRPLPGRAARRHHVVRPRPLRPLPGSGGGPRLPVPSPPPRQRRSRRGERWVRLAAGGGSGVWLRVRGSVGRQPGCAEDTACRGRCRLGVPRLQALLSHCRALLVPVRPAALVSVLWGVSEARQALRVSGFTVEVCGVLLKGVQFSEGSIKVRMSEIAKRAVSVLKS